MTAQPSGEENYGPLLRHSRSRRSRPSARSAIFRGRMRARPDRTPITETMATGKAYEIRRQTELWRHPPSIPATEPARSGTAPRRTCPAFPVAIGLRTIRAPVLMPQQANRIRLSTPVTGFSAHRSRISMTWKDRLVPDPGLPANCRAGSQTRAIFPPAGPGGAMPVKRANAMSSTKILQT